MRSTVCRLEGTQGSTIDTSSCESRAEVEPRWTDSLVDCGVFSRFSSQESIVNNILHESAKRWLPLLIPVCLSIGSSSARHIRLDILLELNSIPYYNLTVVSSATRYLMEKIVHLILFRTVTFYRYSLLFSNLKFLSGFLKEEEGESRPQANPGRGLHADKDLIHPIIYQRTLSDSLIWLIFVCYY